MGLFDPPRRPKKIELLNVENSSSVAMVTYTATYSDRPTKNIRVNVKALNSSVYYQTKPKITDVERIGRVRIGLLMNDKRILFLVKLDDGTVDLIQEKEGSARCIDLMAKAKAETSRQAQSRSIGDSSQSAVPTYRDHVEDMDIPIEVLPNLYSLSLSNVSLKHHVSFTNGKKSFDYAVLKCKINYSLNGRKEGKRYVIFTSYDEKDGVVEIRGDNEKCHFTAAGHDFVEVCFNDYGNNPISRISVSVKEI